MHQNAGGTRTVGEELAAVFLRGDAEADGAFLQRNGAVADHTVKTEAGNMENILGFQGVGFALTGGIGVGQVAPAVAVDFHLIGDQRIDAVDLVPPCANDLAVGIAPKQQVRQHGLTPHKRGHFSIGLIMQQPVQRMLGSLAAAGVGGLVYVERQAGDGFGDHANAGVHRGNLYRGGRCDGLAGGA